MRGDDPTHFFLLLLLCRRCTPCVSTGPHGRVHAARSVRLGDARSDRARSCCWFHTSTSCRDSSRAAVLLRLSRSWIVGAIPLQAKRRRRRDNSNPEDPLPLHFVRFYFSLWREFDVLYVHKSELTTMEQRNALKTRWLGSHHLLCFSDRAREKREGPRKRKRREGRRKVEAFLSSGFNQK